MIAPPAGARIYLACGVTDMRNYAERRIMLSPGCPRPQEHALSGDCRASVEPSTPHN
jgi:hypothetical protein